MFFVSVRVMKEFYFLSGLPRSGNTLLASILNQNSKISVSANSPVSEIMKNLDKSMSTDEALLNFPDYKSYENVIKNVLESYYQNSKANYIIDRAPWGTPINLDLLKKYRSNNIKIIVLLRDIPEVLASFVRWSERNKSSFLNQFKTTEEKCDFMMRSDGQIMRFLSSAANLTKEENNHYALFLQYDDIVNETELSIRKIYDFLNIPYYSDHYFSNLKQLKVNNITYNDNILGKNLHKITEKEIKRSSYSINQYLPQSVIDKYSKYTFWQF